MSHYEVAISIATGVLGWFLGIMTRPFVEKRWIRLPRLAVTHECRIDQTVRGDDGSLSSNVHVSLIFQNQSDYDAHGFSIQSVIVRSENDFDLNVDYLKHPVLITKEKDFTFRFNFRVPLSHFLNYEKFEYSIPMVLSKGPFTVSVKFHYKNSLGKQFKKSTTIEIYDKRHVKEGFFVM